MDWWKIDSVESGRININGDVPLPRDRDLSADLMNGDGPADVMDDALRKITEMYHESWGRGPKADELHACLNFCMNPRLNGNGVFKPGNDARKKI